MTERRRVVYVGTNTGNPVRVSVWLDGKLQQPSTRGGNE